MCGINGLFNLNGKPVSKEVVEKMNNILAYRGPDAEGIYHNNNITLGHRRLSIIDLDQNNNQPLYSEDKRYAIVYNGEIYNYKEIKSQLTGEFKFKTEGDTEVLLAAYIKYGANALRMLNGMFAFAIWDNLKKELFVARDRVGIKPFYYFYDNQNFGFSSSLRALMESDLMPRKIDDESLVDFFRYQTVHAPKTIIKDIKVLEPGSWMLLHEDQVKHERYYQLNQEYSNFKGSYDDAKAAVRDQLNISVKKRLVADVPFGAFLSGGIDSSLIVSLMAENSSQSIKTFNVSFNEDEFSESEYARLIADKYATDHTEIKLSVNEFKELIPQGLSFMDHPSGDGLNTYVVSKKTHEAGVKMALSGLGGDELFGGYSVFKQIPQLRAKKWLKSFPVFGRRPFANFYHLTKGTVQSKKISEILKLEEFDTEHVYSFYRTLLFENQIKKLFGVYKLPTNRVFELTNKSIGYGTNGWRLPDLSKISVAEMETYMSNVLLRDTDVMTMANALEVRVPFLDHDLIHLVLGIPDQYKRPITPKKLLVESFSDKLPNEVVNRQKMGFVLPYNDWMKKDLKEICEEGLNALGNLEVIKKNEVNSLWNRFLNGDKEITWSRIWALVVLGDWIKRNNVVG